MSENYSQLNLGISPMDHLSCPFAPDEGGDFYPPPPPVHGIPASAAA
ncbi:hypothetical protein [Enterovirga aerilata]|uniref:Uncharacterized protein n=1 Tax=Enterovirga aerilata TaxID=2730920 RepID=A0A849I8X7_9HYPH|nr:hypothetical protein [Enterovirga sp. DB1703]NNM73848.1 hypothetical protein [Enterovirga sp. DB1703]